jgi:hypothetical protein
MSWRGCGAGVFRRRSESNNSNMKITDYEIIEGTDRQDLVKRVKAAAVAGWETFGQPQLVAGGDIGRIWWQAMVKKFDPHAGEVWVKEPGQPGCWEKIEPAK